MAVETGYTTEVKADFRDAMRGVAATVTIVTAADARLCHGMTATAVTSLSMEPPSLLVCVNNRTRLHGVLLASSRFCVNVLRAGQADLSAAFSGAVPSTERFRLGAWEYTADGIGFLTDAQANLFCRKVTAVPYATHTIFIGEVEAVQLRRAVEPLIYHNSTYCMSVPASGAERVEYTSAVPGEVS